MFVQPYVLTKPTEGESCYSLTKKGSLTYCQKDQDGNNVFFINSGSCDVLNKIEISNELVEVVYGTEIIYKNVKSIPPIPLIALSENLELHVPSNVLQLPCEMKYICPEERTSIIYRIASGERILDKENLVMYEGGKVKRVFTDYIVDVRSI